MVDEHGAPLVVLLAALRHPPAALRLQLLGDGPDVVRLDAAAAADVAHTQLVGLPRVLVHLPPGAQARLQGGGKLGQCLVPAEMLT